MPEEKLSYSRGVLEKIRASYDKLSRDELLDLICYISKTYIVEQTIPFDIPLPEKEEAPPDREVQDSAAPAVAQETPAKRFATLMEGLKKRTQLPQLEHFSIEDGKAVLVVDNQKITFGDRVTVEFVPVRGRPANAPATPAAAAPRPSPAAASPAPPAPRSQPPEPPAPGARPGLPGGDGRIHQGGPRPPPAPPSPPKKKDGGDLTDVDHIVERFRRLDLD